MYDLEMIEESRAS